MKKVLRLLAFITAPIWILPYAICGAVRVLWEVFNAKVSA